MSTSIQQRFSRVMDAAFRLEPEEKERAPYKGRYSTSTPKAPGALTPTAPVTSRNGESAPLKQNRRVQERYSLTHSNDIFETCKSPRSYASGATHSSSAAMSPALSPQTLSPQSPLVQKRTPAGPPSRRFSTGMPASSNYQAPRQSSRSSIHTKPVPPPGPPSGITTPRGHRWLGPMPEGPPSSILQPQSKTGSQTGRGTSIGAMRSRRYMPSSSPPPARSSLRTTPTPPKSRHPTNLPVAPRRSTSVNAATRCSSQQLTPRGSGQGTALPRHASPTISSSSIIRHKSATPVRITKDVQMTRERERQTSVTQPSPRQRTPSAGMSSRYESPLRRRAKAAASPGIRPVTSLNQSPRPHEPVPPINSAALHKRSESRGRSDSAALTTPRQLTAAPAEVSAAMTDAVGVSSAVSVSVMNTPGNKSRHLGERGAGQPAERPSSTEELLEGYEMGPVIGEGGFCKVKRAKHRASQQDIAVKVINRVRSKTLCIPSPSQKALKDKHDWRRVGREIRILKRLKNHPAIIHMYDVISMPSEVFVIQELAQGGSLLDYIRDRKRVSENLAIRFFLQVVAGLQYCHDREVVHRDIKLENLLLDSDRNMKIIDFGLAAIFTEGKALNVHCGSPSYAAPEIIDRKSYSGPPVDVWSLGIVTFAMVCGHLPFYSRKGRSDLSRKIIAGKYTAPDYMSDSMKDIVAGMLALDPTQRFTLPQLYTHRWVTGSLASRSLTLPRALLNLNEATNTYECDPEILEHMEQLGVDQECIIQDLAAGECNQITATYFLFAEAVIEGKGLPLITKSSRHLGSSLVCRSRAAQAVHGFSLDIEDSVDRDDQAHFAPSRSRRATAERAA